MEYGGGVHKRALTSVADHDGILDEILARLPVKSLMRFRCVCKSWRALISHTYFVTKHFNYAGRGITGNCSRLLMSTSPFESVDYEALKDLNDGDAHLAIRKLDFPVMFPESMFRMTVGSCNGLICVQIDQGVVVLWNPCTGDYKVLPKPTVYCCSIFYGFGYDSSTDDYKVMRGCSYRVRDSGETVVQVFSLKTGSWRTHRGLNYFDLVERGCFLNGGLHWLETTFTNCRPVSRIISFDLKEEKFKEMLPLPYHSCFSDIFSLGDCLCLYISGILDRRPTGFRIWMMKEYGVKDSWTEVVASENPEGYEYSLLTPLCILENGEVLMVKKGNYHSLVLYSSKEQTFRNVIRTRNKWKLDGAFYRETLVSPGTSSVPDI